MSKSPETVVYLPGRFFLRRRPSRFKKITGWDMSKSPNIVERLRYGTAQRNYDSLIELCTEAADELERLRQEVLTLRGMHQGYRDEIVEHLREIERLKAEIKQRKYRTVDWLFD